MDLNGLREWNKLLKMVLSKDFTEGQRWDSLKPSWSTISISWRNLIKKRSCPWKVDLWATVPKKMNIRQMTIFSMLPGLDLISASRARPWSQFSLQFDCEQPVSKATYLFILQGEVKPSHCSLEIFVKWMNAWETSVKGSMGHTSVYTTVRKCRSSRLPIQETQGQQSSWKQAHCFYLTSVFLWCLGMRW